MRPSLPAWRSRARAVVAAVAMIAATALAAPAAHADASNPSGPPTLTNGFGLTQVTDPSLQNNPYIPAATATDFTITVTTPDVANAPGTVGHHIRIILPPDYYSDPAARYPVLYLLNGSPGDPCDYFSPANLPKFNALAHTMEMITVMPDGGARGWYSNWLDQTTPAGAQEWESFETDQVIPFIDANLRTIADKADRAIAGISMGGFGALHLAQDNPGLFSQVASLSGDVDMGEDAMDLRLATVASLTDALGALDDASNESGIPAGSGLWSACEPTTLAESDAPAVSSDALFGSPYPVSTTPPYNDSLWNAADPVEHAAAFAGTNVSIYVGNGDGNPISLEFWLESASQHLDAALTADGQTPYFVDYGNGAGWAGCDGNHDGGCWDQDLASLLPRLNTAFHNTGGTGPVTGYQGLCLDVRNAAVAPGTAVQVYGCNGASQQSWTVGSSNTVQAYGECLDVVGGGTWDGTQVDLYTCNGTGAQQWIPQADGALLNPQSGKCLDDTGWGGAGTQAQIWDCTGAANQHWDLPSLTA